MSTNPTDLNLADYVRNIPDFPKPGILFRDITPLLAAPAAFRLAVVEMANPFRRDKIDVVAAAEARGFIFAAPVALELNASLVPIRKPGKLPYSTQALTYDLEYGSDTLEIHTDAVAPGSKVLVVDDLLATGGTVEACCRLVEKAGGIVVGCAFLIELADLNGAVRIAQYKTISLIKCE
jgi:adenine phosphoribosyltransferase